MKLYNLNAEEEKIVRLNLMDYEATTKDHCLNLVAAKKVYINNYN
jgi:hypothetical protein